MTRRRWFHLGAISLLLAVVLGPAAVGRVSGSHPAGDAGASPTTSPPATPITVESCRLARGAQVTADYVSAGFPVSALRMDSRGAVRVPVIFVDFPDSRAAARTPRSAWTELSPAQDFLRDVSYGRMEVIFEPLLRWVHLSRPAEDYGITRSASPSTGTLTDYVREAVERADRRIDFTGVSSVLVVVNRETTAIDYSPALVVTSPVEGISTHEGSVITSGAALGADTWSTWGWRVIPHELGHALGLVDLYDGSRSDYVRLHRFVGTWDLMGDPLSGTPEYLAWNRWLLGWIRDSQIRCLIGTRLDATVTLTAIERRQGMKAAVVRLSPTRALVMESRRVLGHDTASTYSHDGVDEGVLVYVVDTAIDTLKGPIRVLAGERASDRSMKARAPLAAGESLTYAGVTVRVVSTIGSRDTLTVTGRPIQW